MQFGVKVAELFAKGDVVTAPSDAETIALLKDQVARLTADNTVLAAKLTAIVGDVAAVVAKYQ